MLTPMVVKTKRVYLLSNSELKGLGINGTIKAVEVIEKDSSIAGLKIVTEE